MDKEKLTLLAQAADCKLTMLRQRIEKDRENKKKYLVIWVAEGHDEVVAKLPTKELRVEMVRNP